MRKIVLALFVFACVFTGIAGPRYVAADALCYAGVVPTPIPTKSQITLGVCPQNILQVQSVGPGGSPLPTAAPAATPPYQIVCATTAPAGSTICPTPIPFPTLGVVCISGCPTPNPVQTQPFQVNCVSGCATPIPVPTCAAGVPCVQITGLPNPLPVTTPPPGPTPIQTNANGGVPVDCVHGCSTPIPNSTSAPYFVSCVVVSTGVCPTPLAIQPVSPATLATPAATATIAASVTAVQIFAGNAALNGFTICNSSTSDVYFNFGTTATLGPPFWQHFPSVTVSATTVEPCFTVYGVGVYRGPIWGIWTSATGNAVFTWW